MRKLYFITKNKLQLYYNKYQETIFEIADRFNCSTWVIRNRMKFYKIYARTTSLSVKRRNSLSKENNPNWRGGIYRFPTCSTCGKQLSNYNSKYCGKHKGIAISLKCRNRDNSNYKNRLRKYCLDCGKILSESSRYKNVYRCKSCSGIYTSRIPEKCSNWIDGRSSVKYPREFNLQLKEFIRNRDNYRCQNCNKTEKDLIGFHKKLDVHHIDYNKTNCNLKNLITLCRYCNSHANSNRDYWYSFFTYLMENK